jgi:hypothetical protein
MPRPRFKPTQEQRLMVKSMAAYGVKQEDIGKVVGLRSPKTLRKHFREEITRGSIDAIARVGQTLFQMATSGKHVVATIFFLKTRGSWREGSIQEAPPAPIPDFVVALEKKGE